MIPLFKPFIPDEVDGPLLETLHSGYIGQGLKVEEFERKFSAYIGNSYCVSTNSCTAALTLALRIAGVGPGTACLTTPMTCTATNLPILAVGGTPIFCDVDPDTGLIDPWEVEANITSETKAILAVDWGGNPVDVDRLMDIADRHGLKLIIDAAHSLGADYVDGSRVGARGHFVCFSFQAIKHITTIDGGMLTCIDYEDYKKAKLLRWFGIDREAENAQSNIDVDITDYGYKFHMNDVNATIGIVQMDHLTTILAQHRNNAQYYDDHLNSDIIIPYSSQGHRNAYWLYTILLPERDTQQEFKQWMADRDVMVDRVHRRNDEYSVFAPYKYGDFYGLSNFSHKMICIPVHWALSESDREHIAYCTNEFVETR